MSNDLLFLYQLEEGMVQAERTKERKVRNRVKLNPSQLKKLLKGKTIKNTDKEEYIELLADSLPLLNKELYKLGAGNSQVFEDVQGAVDILTNPLFVKRLKKAIDLVEQYDGHAKLDVLFSYISDLYNSRNRAFSEDEEVIGGYTKLFAKYVGEKKIKKLAKQFGCEKVTVLSILLAGQAYDGVKAKKLTQKFRGVLNEVYKIKNLDKNMFREIIKLVFPRKRNMLLQYLMSEKPPVKGYEKNYNIVTNAMLSMLEKMDQDDRKDLIKAHAKAKIKNPKLCGYRLSKLDNYPGTKKTVERLIATGFDKSLFV